MGEMSWSGGVFLFLDKIGMQQVHKISLGKKMYRGTGCVTMAVPRQGEQTSRRKGRTWKKCGGVCSQASA
jgi:hypothetical protein